MSIKKKVSNCVQVDHVYFKQKYEVPDHKCSKNHSQKLAPTEEKTIGQAFMEKPSQKKKTSGPIKKRPLSICYPTIPSSPPTITTNFQRKCSIRDHFHALSCTSRAVSAGSATAASATAIPEVGVTSVAVDPLELKSATCLSNSLILLFNISLSLVNIWASAM